jgi:hypothetical protein
LRKQALVWRGIVEGGVFLSQLVWVYVLQTFGADKEKSDKFSSAEEVDRATARDVERLTHFDDRSSVRASTKERDQTNTSSFLINEGEPMQISSRSSGVIVMQVNEIELDSRIWA